MSNIWGSVVHWFSEPSVAPSLSDSDSEAGSIEQELLPSTNISERGMAYHEPPQGKPVKEVIYREQRSESPILAETDHSDSDLTDDDSERVEHMSVPHYEEKVPIEGNLFETIEILDSAEENDLIDMKSPLITEESGRLETSGHVTGTICPVMPEEGARIGPPPGGWPLPENWLPTGARPKTGSNMHTGDDKFEYMSSTERAVAGVGRGGR